VITKQFDSPLQLAAAFAADFAAWVDESPANMSVCLSGGSTPKLLFSYWASNPVFDWSRVHFFFGDERCVSPDDPESNFGAADELFFQPAAVPQANIHRIRGEADPVLESIRYAEEIDSLVRNENQRPQFDLIMLGMGADGHTASIFPDQMQLMDSSRVCEVAVHPQTRQRRVTLTGDVIANAKRIAFLVTGQDKANTVATILNSERQPAQACQFPAAHFLRLPQTILYVDQAALGSA
jgi:6-phosphogluconolactonase